MQGYNPWNAFHADINESVVLETIDLLIQMGLVKAGYTYFNLDGEAAEALIPCTAVDFAESPN